MPKSSTKASRSQNMDDARISVSTEAGAHDEAATRAASSHGPVSALPSDTPPEGEQQESQPVVEDADDERGADQDPDAAPETSADDLEVDLEALTAKAGKADEYLELAQRTQADFENFRKRAARDAAVAQDRGVAKLAKELLPAVDNLDRALQAAETHGNGQGDETLASGVKLVHADVIAALARVGIEPFSPEGEPFDPQHHEAIAQMPVEGAASGTIVEVYQRGYRLGETVLRPARVVVAA
jgi:molecular chaperone GrpE